jgi:hypothetical protein
MPEILNEPAKMKAGLSKCGALRIVGGYGMAGVSCLFIPPKACD